MESKDLDLKRLELDEKKADRDHQIRLKEIDLKEADAKRSRWANPLVLSIVAASIAASGNAYISWLNGSNQLAIEATKNAGLRAVEQDKAEAARVLEVLKSDDLKQIATKIKLLIDLGLVSNPNRIATIEAYLQTEPSSKPAPPKDPGPTAEPIIETYRSGWLGGGNKQSDQCNIGRTVMTAKHPGKSILLKSSSEQSKKDFLGRVEYRYFCEFEIR